MALAEVGDGGKTGGIEPDNAREVDRLARRLGDPARRAEAFAIPYSHSVIIAGSNSGCPSFARIGGFDPTKIEMLEHKRLNKASQVALADKVLHPRRQQ
jgi:hypothetical protein